LKSHLAWSAFFFRRRHPFNGEIGVESDGCRREKRAFDVRGQQPGGELAPRTGGEVADAAAAGDAGSSRRRERNRKPHGVNPGRFQPARLSAGGDGLLLKVLGYSVALAPEETMPFRARISPYRADAV